MSSYLPHPFRSQKFLDTPDRFVILYANYLQAIADETRRLGCQRVLLLVSPSLDSQTERICRLEGDLGERVVAKKVGVSEHTSYADVLDLVDQIYESQADSIVTVGSSSYSDAAKIALIVHSSLKSSDLSIAAMDSLAAKYNKDEDLVAPRSVLPPTLKLILTPTVLSASEYDTTSGATHPETHKKVTFSHPLCIANAIIFDPELCATIPPRLWLSTGMSVISTCIEALCAGSRSDVVHRNAEDALLELVPGLLACNADISDAAARGACQLGLWRARDVIHYKAPLGAAHAIASQLGSVAGVPHGETSCVLLPAVMKWNKGVNSARQEMVVDILWNVSGKVFDDHGLSREKADAGDLIKTLITSLGLPTTLGDVGVTDESRLDRVVEYTLADACGKTNPRRIVCKDQVREILRMAS